MQIFNLGVAWCWEYDKDLVIDLEKECLQRGVSIYRIAFYNLKETIEKIESGELNFNLFFDRASDLDADFDDLVFLAKRKGIKMINDIDRAIWATDKATMHLEFLSAGIDVPYTLILSPHEVNPELTLSKSDLDKIGIPFVIKPACGGCGDGVILDADSWEDIKLARKDFPDDKYLVQGKIVPKMINGQRAWFRVYYSCGEVFCCFWDDQTKIANLLYKDQIDEKVYSEIENIIGKIAQISHLDLFSTEIALSHSNKLIVIDHVNDQIDLRKKSQHYDGVPDEVVHNIVFSLVTHTQRTIAQEKSNLRVSQ